uniref:Uncharacterized protein n=1 Tax=Physcomitrium patens TaxID=3218 RepID=A0A2K1KEB2_PHYPA|nr:hypothetical protein PHYPA_008489 [Physcomitrium patens]
MGNPEITFNDTPLEFPNEELPHERMRGRFLLRTLIDIEMLRRDMQHMLYMWYI